MRYNTPEELTRAIARHMPLMTAADFCDRNGRVIGDREALVDRHRRLSWSQVSDFSDRLALGLIGLGLREKSLVMVQLPNWTELFLARLAAEKAGLSLITVTPTFRRTELAPILEFARPEAAIIPRQFHGFDHYGSLEEIRPPELRHVLVAGEDVPAGGISIEEILSRPTSESERAMLKTSRHSVLDSCQIATTSGSTGIPKCVEVPLYTRLLTGWIHSQRFGVTPGETLAAATSIVTGTADALVYNGGCQLGCRIVLLDSFEAEESCAILEAERVNVIPMVPTMMARILALANLGGFDLSSIRTVVNHGSNLPYSLGSQFEQAVGCSIVQGYGSVDCGGIAATFVHSASEIRLGTVGPILDGNDFQLLDDKGREVPGGEVGRLFVRGLNTDARYFNNPELNARARRTGYFDTQELCRLDDQGNLILIGRENDMIIRGGQNVFPADVEAVLIEHPKILEVAVVGATDAEMGERVCAFVVCRAGETMTLSEVASFLGQKGLARFKWPERMEFLDSLPKVPSGHKIDKKRLRDEMEKGLKQSRS
ncbi:MAG: AMP-binding protein [Deltaproteobacteria bacterium]|nr:AMP-binding protein [Deltaproteobacteria bacterium]